jgi:hypothetical protein
MIPEHFFDSTYYCSKNDVFVIGDEYYGKDLFDGKDYSSKDCCISKEKLENFLIKHDFFKNA